MPRNHGKLKIQWIVQNGSRNATFRKRRATLLEKAKELSILCQVPVAMVVYGPAGDAAGAELPACWPPEIEKAKDIMRKYMELPESSKETRRLDNEGFLRQAIKKMGKRLESYKAAARQLEVNLVLNDISLGRRSGLDDLDPELAAAVRKEVHVLRSLVYQRVNSLFVSGAAAAAEDEAAAPAPPAVLVSSHEEPLMVAPLAFAPPAVVANAPAMFVPPLLLEPEMMLVPPQELLVAPPQEPPMVPPFAMAPPTPMPVLVPVPLPAVGDPLAPAAAGVGGDHDEDDDGFPRDGSYLLEVADAILDDGSGHAVQATEEDVDRLLWEHGLESFIKPKPM